MWQPLPDTEEWTYMSRTKKAFANGKAFIPFLTAGDPDLGTTEALILAMAEAGADLIEIGIPFSDPIAEGIVIQAADERALRAGTTTDLIFDMVQRVRKQTEVPLAFMTYMNPIFTYGTERFMQNAHAAGVDAVIVPDVPFEEKAELEDACRANDMDLISMIAPTSADRAQRIAAEAQGFLYCVSSLGVTGMRSNLQTNIGALIQQVKQGRDIPCAIGFGISTPEQAAAMAQIADGVICGSAIVKLIETNGTQSVAPVQQFVKAMKDAVSAGS